MTTLFISPVPRVSAQGREKQTYSFVDHITGNIVPTGQPMRKQKADGAGSRIKFSPDYENMRLKTGLDELVDNPFYGSTSGNIPQHVKEATKITKQTLFEIEDGVPAGTYTNQMTGGGIFRLKQSTDLSKIQPNFMETFEVILYDRVNIFNDLSPRGRMAIQLLKSHPRVAPDKNSVNSTVHTFYVSEENEAMVEKLRKQEQIDEANYEKVNLFKKAGEFIVYKVGSLCMYKDNRPVVKGQATPDLVKQQINAYLADGKHQMENVDKFMKIIEMLNGGKEGKQRFDIKYLIQQAFNVNVLDARDGYIYWNSKSGTANMYKFADGLKLENLILAESLIYNPDEGQTNAYGDLLNEVIKKGGRIE